MQAVLGGEGLLPGWWCCEKEMSVKNPKCNIFMKFIKNSSGITMSVIYQSCCMAIGQLLPLAVLRWVLLMTLQVVVAPAYVPVCGPDDTNAVVVCMVEP